MITLNSDKGLVLVARWDDITTRPGFDGNLDPTAVELESILGSYVYPTIAGNAGSLSAA